MTPILESIAENLNYGDMPETWQVPEADRFSEQKTFYDYQRSALENAARALYSYYGQEHDWHAGEAHDANDQRKQYFASLYRNFDDPLAALILKKYESRADEAREKQNQVFRILSDFITSYGNFIPYYKLINRMCFWMATGSGKTLVMVKLIEYLHFLKRHGEIPPHHVLILAPSNHLIDQIGRTVDEFNRSNGLHVDLLPLRQAGKRAYQSRLGGSARVYYHRSDNVSDVNKEALIDYRTYENGGRWYVFLDEAHKGSKEDSKRQAYYAVMAREGFLFNFSATFTDNEDVVTTVKKYNLEEFIKNGHGKNIYLNKVEYDAFRNREKEISHDERRKIVLKSLITLACVSRRVDKLRKATGIQKLYHQPLMLTLVNSVNTKIESERNDLWAFFQTLREIAVGEIDQKIFEQSKEDLLHEWENMQPLFEEHDKQTDRADHAPLVEALEVAGLREAIFHSQERGALQIIRSSSDKELALQIKNADAPFALIRIGNTSKWRNQLLAGYEETTTLKEQSFFKDLEQSSITILMGSRSFFESWDSNRPNVINFINIGMKDAKKFVVQSIGRGVRIEPLENQRRRFSYLPGSPEKSMIQPYCSMVQLPETLFLFATNRCAIESVLEGLEGLEAMRGSAFTRLEGFEKAPIPKIGRQNMPLLIPRYREDTRQLCAVPFSMSDQTFQKLKNWLASTSDSVFAVRDGLTTSQIAALRDTAKQKGNKLKVKSEKTYASLPFLHSRLLSHFSQTAMASGGVRKLEEEDIVHFSQICVHSQHAVELQEKISMVKQGKTEDVQELAGLFSEGRITREEFDERYTGKDEDDFNDLKIKKIVGHYYLPVVPGNRKASYIQHIIKVDSEVKFLNALEGWTSDNEVPWDAWMFSKIDESLDNVYVPYFDEQGNRYRRFLPDFVFWMCKGNNYQIVFVDPKGTAHTSSYYKIDGYKRLFEQNQGHASTRKFSHGKRWKVSVKLLMFNSKTRPPREYERYWCDDPRHIFQSA